MQLKRANPLRLWRTAGFFMSKQNVVVLKFGSSILRDAAALPGAVDEIDRHVRAGYRVLAIVSALQGKTDALFAEAHAAIGADAGRAIAHYVATGESQSVALLTGALLNAKVNARILEPREAHLRVRGNALDAEPLSIDTDVIARRFERSDVLVMPGFFGIDDEHQVALLGRGGSDYSALFIARQLGAECRLVKDVPGIFERDPAAYGDARRFEQIGWHHALEVAGKLVQPKALQFALTHRVTFSVGAMGCTEGTIVGDFESPLTFCGSAA